MAAIPLSLYLHFPWCIRKCPYCDFNSHSLRGGALESATESAYIDALLRDLDYELQELPDTRPLTSIFCGGGTPSLFSDRALARLLDCVAKKLRFASDIEITLEANPGTVDAAHFRGYRATGINRLSIGAQSFDDDQLRRLGRIHGRAEVLDAVRTARTVGFENVNIDMMYGLPQQTVAAALADLEAAVGCSPEHLSWYQLTVEPNTRFAVNPPPLPDDEAAWSIQEAGKDLLARYGYLQYEVSAYARRGLECQHNVNYWRFGDYLGIGSGAHGKRSTASGIWRRARQKHPRRYMETAGTGSALQEQRRVESANLPFEYAMNAMRLERCFTLSDYERATGLSRTSIIRVLDRARRRGLLETDPDCIRPSALGRAHLNSLLVEFLS